MNFITTWFAKHGFSSTYLGISFVIPVACHHAATRTSPILITRTSPIRHPHENCLWKQIARRGSPTSRLFFFMIFQMVYSETFRIIIFITIIQITTIKYTCVYVMWWWWWWRKDRLQLHIRGLLALIYKTECLQLEKRAVDKIMARTYFVCKSSL